MKIMLVSDEARSGHAQSVLLAKQIEAPLVVEAVDRFRIRYGNDRRLKPVAHAPGHSGAIAVGRNQHQTRHGFGKSIDDLDKSVVVLS